MALSTKPTDVADPATARAIEDIRKLAVGRGLLTGAVEVANVQLSTTAVVRVPHKLGRKVRGWFISRVTSDPGAAFSVWDELSQNSDTEKFLYLRAVGGAPVVTLVVF